MNMNEILDAYKGKRVLVTGHTGFKGSWLCQILKMANAEVIGYALAPEIYPSLFEVADIASGMDSVIGDIRDLAHLRSVFDKYQPEYVFHLAAQPIVRQSYRNPVDTYSTNVMGTVNLLECVRHTDSVRSVVNVTTDKVYLNEENGKAFKENDKLDGFDPYSNSKSCSELVTHSYVKSFLKEKGVCVSTVRAGNVIGGGDFEVDRIIPDCVRAVLGGKVVNVRNPYSIRPYQHVLEPLYVYLMIASMQLKNPDMQGAYNVGPDQKDCWTTGQLVDCFCKEWGEGCSWVNQSQGGPHEAGMLILDCQKLKNTFGWKPHWNVHIAIDKIVEWTKIYRAHESVKDCMKQQIKEYLA